MLDLMSDRIDCIDDDCRMSRFGKLSLLEFSFRSVDVRGAFSSSAERIVRFVLVRVAARLVLLVLGILFVVIVLVIEVVLVLELAC